MTRLERKNREDIDYKGCGGITDAFDDAIKEQWRINDKELDWIAEHASDEELDIMLGNFITYSFSEKKKALNVSNNLIEKCNIKENI